MQVTLTTLSQHDGCPDDELIQDLLAAGLTHYYLSYQWETLSTRERDVAALVCLGYTNKENGLVTVLDGGNCFPAYHIAQLIRRKSLQMDSISRRIFIQSAFTGYQAD